MPNSFTNNLAVKVPAITIFFWLIKVLSTTVGETFADYLDGTVGLGLGKTAWVMTTSLIVILVIQFATKRYTPFVYWLSIVLISTVGTLITDNLHDGLGIENWQMIIGFGLALAIIFYIWHKREGSLEMKSINTRVRESYYWLAILFTFALGTAAGDIFLDDLGVPLLVSFIVFALALGVIWFVWRTKVLDGITGFWIAYILTRPLGAALGDLLAQPKKETGLGLGTTVTSYIFLGAIAVLVIYLTASKRDRLEAK